MNISINKKTNTTRPVKYAALSSGTISHVWYDDEAAASAPKRQNRIMLTRDDLQAKTRQLSYDA
jgi:hypothetical protein